MGTLCCGLRGIRDAAQDLGEAGALGPVCFIFSEPHFSENQDSEISMLLGESDVRISWVFSNPDYFESIL